MKIQALIFLVIALSAPEGKTNGMKKAKYIEYLSPRLEVFIPAFLQAESENMQHRANGDIVKSPAGALGRWQVMPDCLGTYNKHKNKNFKVKQLADPEVNEIIGRWYLNYCLKLSRGTIVLAFNRYHQGHNSDKHRLYKSYLMKICPAEYREYMKNKTVIQSIKIGKREWIVWE
jgi:hypothetical protein